MHPTGVASAAWVFASAPSKVPFYVCGGVLAGWAVVLAATGLTHPGFPGSAVQQRLVMLTSFLLVAATLTAAVATAGESVKEPAAQGRPAQPAGGSGASSTLRLSADPSGRLAYDTTRATVKAGTVDIAFTNRSPIPHDVTIAQGGKVLAATKTIQGATAQRTADLRPGDYVFYCSVDQHRQAGMQGRLTVR